MPTLSEMLQQLVAQQGESLQLRPDQPPIVFVERQPRPLAGAALTLAELEALVS